MRKWERRFKKYLDSKPKRGPTVYSEGNPCNNSKSIGTPFSYGNCVLWKPGEEEEYRQKLEVEDETSRLRESGSVDLPELQQGEKIQRMDFVRRSGRGSRVKRKRSQMGAKVGTVP